MSARATDTSKKIVVFASGRGSNFRALCAAIDSGLLRAQVLAVVSNTLGSGAAELARARGLKVVEVESRGLERAEHEARVLRELGPAAQCDWVVLAGYMRLFTPQFIERYHDTALGVSRIVNVHPSLLPSFTGKDGYAQAFRHGVKVTGATVHLVTAGLDDGPIVAQAPLEVRDEDTEQTLTARGLELEHRLYAEALARLFAEPFKVEGRRIIFARHGREKS